MLDDRFRVARLTCIPLLLLTIALLISDLFILYNPRSEEYRLDDSGCGPLVDVVIQFHSWVMAILLIVLLLVLFRPIGHKGFPALFVIFVGLLLLAVPVGLALLWPYRHCRHLDYSVPYWHTLIIAWVHFWPVLFNMLLFQRSLRDWVSRGWHEGKSRGFLSKEYERKPFVGTTQIR